MSRRFHLLIVLTLMTHCFAEEVTVSGLVKVQGLNTVPPAIAQSWIETQIEYIEKSGVSMARADDAAYFLENALRQRGYKKATVDWKLIEDRQILLTVNEGPKYFSRCWSA